MTGGAAVLGDADGVLDPGELARFVTAQVSALGLTGRVCVVVPDPTRSCPLPLLVRAVRDGLGAAVDAVTVLVAVSV